MGEDSITRWIDQLKVGDQQAAQHLWERYYHRLIGIARKKLGSLPRSAKDEDDVVQSAFKSFFLRAQAGQFPELRDRDNLWPLLVLITARKAANQRKHENRARRGGGRPVKQLAAETTDSAMIGFVEAIADEPSPDDVAVFLAQLESFMDSLDDPSHRLILLWKLEARTNEEISRHLDCALCSVERKLRHIRTILGREISAFTD